MENINEKQYVCLHSIMSFVISISIVVCYIRTNQIDLLMCIDSMSVFNQTFTINQTADILHSSHSMGVNFAIYTPSHY